MSNANSILKKMVSQSAIYWAGTMLSKMVGFFLIPFYTRYLTPSDYGVLELLTLTVDVLGLFVGLQLIHAVAKYYESADGEAEKKSVISTAIVLLLFTTVLFFGSLQMFNKEISLFVFGHPNNGELFQIVFIAATFGILVQIPLLYLRILDKSKIFVVVTLTQLFFTIVLTIYFVAFLDLSVLGVVLGNAIVVFFVCMFLLFITLRKVGIKPRKKIALSIISYSAPLIPGVIGMFILHFSDRFFLNKYATLEQVGIYAIGYKFGFLLNSLIIGPFNLMWGAKMFDIYRSPEKFIILNKVLRWLSFILLSSVLVLTLFIQETLILMTTEKYYAAATVVPFIALAYAFNGMTRVVMTPLYAEKRTGAVGLINSSAAILCLLLNYVLIPNYGIIGAAMATLLSFVYIVVLSTIVSTRVTKAEWVWGPIFKLMILVLVAGSIGYFVDFEQIWIELSVKVLLLIMVLPMLYWVGFFEKDEINKTLSLVRNLQTSITSRL